MRDAVMVIPGIMGSELEDSEGHLLWGTSPRALGRMWMTGQLSKLHVTPRELEGGPRLNARRLLQAPAWAPFLHGLLPYSKLLRRLASLCGDARAVGKFPYDWRLSTDTHVGALVEACHRHLESWRALLQATHLADPSEIRLVIVAHSMGGLLAHMALKDSRLAAEVRLVITLGTPFYGSINAVEMLADGGGGAPLPQMAARDLARTCPGVYDLLPRYKCLETAPSMYRALTDSDIAAIGGRKDLARNARERWEGLELHTTDFPPSPVQHVAAVGTRQPTSASMRLNSGAVVTSPMYDGEVDYGDSTVWRRSAAPAGTIAHAITQKHMGLAVTDQAWNVIEDKVLGRDAAPPLGTRPIGVSLPDQTIAGREVTLEVIEQPDDVGARPGDPVGIEVVSTDLTTSNETTWEAGRRQDDRVVITHPGLPAGLHQVSVKAGGFEAVTEIILVRNVR